MASTAFIRDLKRGHGDDIKIDYETNQPEILVGNPYLEPVSPHAKVIRLDYSEGLERSKRGEKMHFITWFHKYWEMATGMHVHMGLPCPDLHLPERLKKEPPIAGRYWLVFAGGKKDCTIKHWDFSWYREVVADLHNHYDVWCVQSGATGDDHVHPSIPEAGLNLVGWGGLIEMMWQIYHCQGVICPVTCAMHMAAAFNKPCVVLAGGREDPWWEAYHHRYEQFGEVQAWRAARNGFIDHKFLDTVGDLPCCEKGGCWRVHVRSDNPDKACLVLSDRPAGQQELPECMARINPDHILHAVDSYCDELGLRRGGRKPKLLARSVPFKRK